MARPLLLLLLLLTGCQLAQQIQQDPRTHDERLYALLQELDAVRSGVGRELGGRERAIRSQLDRLYYEDPRHVDTAWVMGVLEYEDQNQERATWYLDNVLQLEPSHARAAELRGRIALNEGNVDYAMKVISRAIALSPDDPGLHEVKALAHYLEQRWNEAAVSLREAERLGSPAWRAAFNRGLIAEARGNATEAMALYRTAIDERGGRFPRAEQRLIGVGGLR
ncbi:MAG: tetratricopeptide repeat protein [Planctomycetota bacterium]